jgi:hypothetical protein
MVFGTQHELFMELASLTSTYTYNSREQQKQGTCLYLNVKKSMHHCLDQLLFHRTYESLHLGSVKQPKIQHTDCLIKCQLYSLSRQEPILRILHLQQHFCSPPKCLAQRCARLPLYSINNMYVRPGTSTHGPSPTPINPPNFTLAFRPKHPYLLSKPSPKKQLNIQLSVS